LLATSGPTRVHSFPLPRADCVSSLSSPPASPEGEADGGQAESDEAKRQS